MSKIERGKLPPPKKRDLLQRHARALELEEGTDEWLEFFDLASACAGRIPERIMSDEQLLTKLPLVFRTITGGRLTEEELRKLAEEIRRA